MKPRVLHRALVGAAAVGAVVAAGLAWTSTEVAPVRVGIAAALAFQAVFGALFGRQLVASLRASVAGHATLLVFSATLGVVLGFLTMAESVKQTKDAARREKAALERLQDP